MIAMIFEVWMKSERRDEYLDIAAELKPALADVDGFISVERFESLSEPEKLLSLSFWRDEQAVSAWRNLETHRVAQAKGRGNIFTRTITLLPWRDPLRGAGPRSYRAAALRRECALHTGGAQGLIARVKVMG